MATVQVDFFPQYEDPARKGPRSFDRVRLMPGINEIDADAWKAIADDPLVKQLIESKAIKPPSQSESKSEVKPAPAK